MTPNPPCARDAEPDEEQRREAIFDDLVIVHAAEVVTCAGPAVRAGRAQAMCGVIRDGAVVSRGGRIRLVGKTAEVLPAVSSGPDTVTIDAHGRTVIPGLVDAHTHLVWAGTRADEHAARLAGASYLEIAARGGGISRTVRDTRAATLATLVDESRRRLRRMLACGTTTAEAKSGYGLNLADERKQLEAVAQLAATQPIDLVPTFLGAHVVAPEFAGDADRYVDFLIHDVLPAISPTSGLHEEFSEGLDQPARRSGPTGAAQPTRAYAIPDPHSAHGPRARFVDVFCDRGAFSREQAERLLRAAGQMGFQLKAHVDEFEHRGLAACAGSLGLTSVDHCALTPEAEWPLLARAGTVAVLLPGAALQLGHGGAVPARGLIDASVPVALGTDLNPGTSFCESMLTMIDLAGALFRLTPAEALVAATVNAAAAIGLADRGRLEPGCRADLVVLDLPDHLHLGYHFGVNPVVTVVVGGKVVSTDGK